MGLTTDLHQERFVGGIGVARGKFFRLEETRYRKPTNTTPLFPENWIENSERNAIISY